MSGNIGFLDRLRRFLGTEMPASDAARPAAAAPAAPPPPFDYNDERIPSASKTMIETIRGLLAQIEDQAAKAGNGGDALDTARRIVDVYVPDLMNSYFYIPAEHRAEIFRRTGQSASFQINGRLETIIDQLRSISASFAAGQIQSFSTNLKFIDERFRTPDPF